MNAFLVIIILIMGVEGPYTITEKLPWASVAHCEKYLADPASIETDIQIHLKVMDIKTFCEPRGETAL